MIVLTFALKEVKVILYRGMNRAEDGKPCINPATKRCLTIRSEGRFADIIPDDEGKVHPGDKGLSVNTSINEIPFMFRPKGEHFNGGNDDPRARVYSFDSGRLNNYILQYSKITDTKGVISPGAILTLQDYQRNCKYQKRLVRGDLMISENLLNYIQYELLAKYELHRNGRDSTTEEMEVLLELNQESWDRLSRHEKDLLNSRQQIDTYGDLIKSKKVSEKCYAANLLTRILMKTG